MVMAMFQRLHHKLEGLLTAVGRYPVTTVFLLATALFNTFSINLETEGYSTFIFTFIVGALLSAVGQQLYERFFTKNSERMLLMLGAVLLTGCYYLVIHSASVFSIENGVKTAVTIFALMIAFIWVPTIKSKHTFNESFLSAFKAFFITILFSSVIAGGISVIVFAINHLLLTLSYEVIPHALNLIFTLFAPIFFLSFTPPFPGKKDLRNPADERAFQEEAIRKAASFPKYLTVLVSYIIIPLTAVYTIILLFYVLINIRGDFWTKNLLEPLLVSYAITVIFVYILASMLDNKFALIFRKVFPKVLVPIVLFQVIASTLKIQEIGVTHGRYYVILFGVFALIAGLIFSFMPVRKNGMIAVVLIIFSIISITPPMDAFTVSRVNQTNHLEKVLIENKMLEGNTIVPNKDISNEDKKTITRTVNYLHSIKQTEKIAWMPKKVLFQNHFENTFGFEPTYNNPHQANNQFAHLDWVQNPVMNIEEKDTMVYLSTSSGRRVIPVKMEETDYQLTIQRERNFSIVSLMDENKKALIQFNTMELVEKVLSDYEEATNKGIGLTVEQATFQVENDAASLSILANTVEYYDSYYNADFYLFIQIK